MADATDLKSVDLNGSCGFESRHRYSGMLINTGLPADSFQKATRREKSLPEQIQCIGFVEFPGFVPLPVLEVPELVPLPAPEVPEEVPLPMPLVPDGVPVPLLEAPVPVIVLEPPLAPPVPLEEPAPVLPPDDEPLPELDCARRMSLLDIAARRWKCQSPNDSNPASMDGYLIFMVL